MRPISTTELADLLGGQLDEVRGGHVYGFATDHRDARAGDAFLAIKGAQFDGHLFAQEATKNGAVVAIVERPVATPHILVPNLVEALARMGRRLRSQFNGPVIGVTGSAGKTTTKEFLAAALSPLGNVLKNPGNKNTEYTAPLMWTGLDADTKVAVVEMAMRGFGQIAHLASFAKPTIGLVTNIGYGHMEMVQDREGIARAKSELIEALPSDGICILWAEDDYLERLQEVANGRTVLTFGFSERANCQITSYRILDWSRVQVEGVVSGKRWSAELPAIGRHIALNAAAAILTANLLGVDPAEAAANLAEVELPPMRMEVRDLAGATIILDTYNASPPAMVAAIEALKEVPAPGRRFAVLGEMKELGIHTEKLHREVGSQLGGLDGVMFFGEPMATWARQEALAVGLNDVQIATSLSDVADYLGELKPGDVVLVKGSRALELERAMDLAHL